MVPEDPKSRTTMIDEYTFGRIVIDGEVFSSDVVIYPDGSVKGSWWRKEGHSLCYEDIHDLIDAHPELIIVGKGKPGLMQPEKELLDQLREEGIECGVYPSDEAADRYNEAASQSKVGACFHLTC